MIALAWCIVGALLVFTAGAAWVVLEGVLDGPLQTREDRWFFTGAILATLTLGTLAGLGVQALGGTC